MRFLRRVRAGWRDTVLLLSEFRGPLLVFTLVMVSSGWLFTALSQGTERPVHDLAEGIYIALSLTFLQSPIDFPWQWYLQIFFFALPLIGISILAQGLADFGFLLFNRRLRGKEWEMAVASTYSNHVVCIGLGHLGFRVVQQLTDLQQDVVVVELEPRPDLMERVQRWGVPVITDDGTRESAMVAAGVPRARVIMLCTQDDSLNLRMALKARSMNPKIEVVIRIFDDDFAESLQSQFKFHAISATGMAAPLFAALAADLDITAPITIQGKPHILARIAIPDRSKLNGYSLGEVEERFHINVVMKMQDGQSKFHPSDQELIAPGVTLAVFGEPVHINQLIHENQ